MTVQPQSPIYWHQGLFLQPQHFQRAEAFNEFSRQPVRTYGQQYFWGVGSLRINEPGFGNKLFEILEGDFLFPDGIYAVYPGNCVLQSRSFDEAWVESEKPFTVYLGIFKENPDGNNVTTVADLKDAGQLVTRYAATEEPENITDSQGDGPVAHVRRLRYVLRIFWENEIDELENYHLIPIARLEREGEDVKLAKQFVPPCLSVRSSDKLYSFIKEIRDLIGSRCRQLEAYKSPRDIQGMDLEIRYLIFLLALRSLNRYVPVMQHFTEGSHLHPWQVYLTLRQLVGELSTFSESINAFGETRDGTQALPPYDHENLWLCYATARNLINRLLEGIMMGPEFLIRLEYDGEYYSAELPETFFETGNNYWLVLRTSMEEGRLLESMQHVVKLSAQQNLTTLIARAVPGIPLDYSPETPAGLPRTTNAKYFRIDKDCPQWRDVENNQNVSLYWDTAPKDLMAEIVVLRS